MIVMVTAATPITVPTIHLVRSAKPFCISVRSSANLASTAENFPSILTSRVAIRPSILVSMVSSRASSNSLLTGSI